MTTARDRLELAGLRCECIVGLHAAERLRVQPVDVSIELTLDARTAARSGRLADTIDYARLAGEARFILQHGRFRLLESAAEALAAWCLTRSAQVAAATVRVAKPEALGGLAVPSVRLRRRRSESAAPSETKPFGFVDVVFETPECGLYRERIAPGAVLPTHVHRHLDESELVLDDGLLLQGAPVLAGEARHWPTGFPHRYENPSDRELSFLCIDRPCFRADDEVEVDVAASDLRLPPPERFF